jgi:ribosomal RNA assembly protein
MLEFFQVPKKRVKYIIENIDAIQQKLDAKIEILYNSIKIESNNPIAFLYIKAIARGFNIQDADFLLNSDYSLYIIDLDEYFNTENRISVMKGRIIGRNGSIKSYLEQITDSKICIYGNTVSIIAPFYSIEVIKSALTMIINGAKHSSVLNYLSKAKQRIMYEKLNAMRNL